MGQVGAEQTIFDSVEVRAVQVPLDVMAMLNTAKVFGSPYTWSRLGWVVRQPYKCDPHPPAALAAFELTEAAARVDGRYERPTGMQGLVLAAGHSALILLGAPAEKQPTSQEIYKITTATSDVVEEANAARRARGQEPLPGIVDTAMTDAVAAEIAAIVGNYSET